MTAFADDALVRITPDAIRDKGRVPKNGSVFFTIFQTLTSGALTRREDAATSPASAGEVNGPHSQIADASSLHLSRLRERSPPAWAAGEGECAHFTAYPPDFFDFIIIDECHRGGANAESEWRAIMEYYAPPCSLA